MSNPKTHAILYCEGAFLTTNGKTAHGLIRRSDRFQIISVIDSTKAGGDAGVLLDGKDKEIPVHASLAEALTYARTQRIRPLVFIMGLAPDGGRLPIQARNDIKDAIHHGLDIISGLHDFLSEDEEFSRIAQEQGVIIYDIRKTPPRNLLHFFSGKIEEVSSFVIALLGTDSAVGKRTTAWMLYDALKKHGFSVEFIGTGQTSWLQGARYCIMMDSLINDFVAGEIEHAVWTAWQNSRPDVILIEGQGSLLNPAYPGGFEICAAGRPDVILLQHAPGRIEYDGFPGYKIHDINKQMAALELISDKPVVALTINHEHLKDLDISQICTNLEENTGLPCVDVLIDGADRIVGELRPRIEQKKTTVSEKHET